MKILVTLTLVACSFSFAQTEAPAVNYTIIGTGQMPAITSDKNNIIHLVYGNGDTLLYSFSNDQGVTFATPSIIAVVPQVFTFSTRGPQIAAVSDGLVVTACTSTGDIYSFTKQGQGNWMQGARVNDEPAMAKEGLMALGADGDNLFAAWLDLRSDKRNKIYGARSIDGGQTWQKNVLVYASPDTTVCECCKPSVAVSNNKVYVMFRNQLNGYRDMYLAQSVDGGRNFLQAQKLGTGTWKLKGCPMDGGGLAITKNGEAVTVWRREGTIFAATAGLPEKRIGEGKNCTLVSIANMPVYSWIEDGHIVITSLGGAKTSLGPGIQQALQRLDKGHVLCVWQNDKTVYGSVIRL